MRRHLRHFVPLLYVAQALCLGWALASGCSNNDRPGIPPDVSSASSGGTRPVLSGLAGTAMATGGSGAGADAGAMGGSGGSGPLTCAELACQGASTCRVSALGTPFCECNYGYYRPQVGDECVVDPDCMRVRLMEKGCRQLVGAEPAMGVFVGVETCAGTPVAEQDLGNVNEAFQVHQEGVDVSEESLIRPFPRPVESFVVIAVDMSSSIVNDEGTLDPLITEVEQMVAALEPGPEDPPVFVELIIFGRNLHVLQTFTDDFELLRTQLEGVRANPAVVDPGGTNLNGAVIQGMNDTSTALDARMSNAGGSVVSIGTVVSITDGGDTSGIVFPAARNLDPRLNLVSIGISPEVNYSTLTDVGRNGSFLAPTQESWPTEFDGVIERIRQYPRSSYLLGYCSPAVSGTLRVSISLRDRQTDQTADCLVNAESFEKGTVCDSAFMEGYCSSSSCPTLLACGEICPDSGADAGPVQSDQWLVTEVPTQD